MKKLVWGTELNSWLIVLWLLCWASVSLCKAVVSGEGSPLQDAESLAGHIMYDQRQSGKYNIHVSIKDVAIIEMGQNEILDEGTFGEEEYYYDESDLTVRPISMKSTTTASTPSASNSTSIATSTLHSSSIPTESITTPTLSNDDSEETTLINLDSNKTKYSANLLADIAATQAAHKHDVPTKRYSISTTHIPLISKKTTNVLVLETTTSRNSPSSTHLPPLTAAALITGRSNGRIEEPILHPRHPQRIYAPTSTLTHDENTPEEDTSDSKIYKFKMRRNHKQNATPQIAAGVGGTLGTAGSGGSGYLNVMPPYFGRRCRSHQFRDINGNCRRKRSSSILKKLFSMLVKLPFNQEQQHQADDDEDDSA